MNQEVRHKVIKKYNARCQDCGLTQMQSLTFLGRVLEIHHFYPTQVVENDKFVCLVCRPCHNRYSKVKRTDKWMNEWVWQLIHNTNPDNQRSYLLGDRFALIGIR